VAEICLRGLRCDGSDVGWRVGPFHGDLSCCQGGQVFFSVSAPVNQRV
jgi:hypothetical protein